MPSKAMNLPKDKELEEMKVIEKDVKDLKKDFDISLVDLRKQVDDLQKKAAKTVTERPLLALGVAFAVGMAFGIAISRSSD